MFLSAAVTKKVSSEVWALVHEECLDISISGIKLVCVARYYVVLIPVLFVFLTFCACVGDIWGENGISMLVIMSITPYNCTPVYNSIFGIGAESNIS